MIDEENYCEPESKASYDKYPGPGIGGLSSSGTGERTQGLMHTRQALCLWAIDPGPGSKIWNRCVCLYPRLWITPLCGLCQYGLREFCLRTKLLEETVRSLICSNVLASGWNRKSSQVKGRAVIHPPIPPVHRLPTLLTFSAKPSAFLCLSLPWLLFYGFNINNLPGIVKPSTAQTARKPISANLQCNWMVGAQVPLPRRVHNGHRRGPP